MANTVVIEIHQQRLASSYGAHCLDLSAVDERSNTLAAFVQSNSMTIFTCPCPDSILMPIRAALASASESKLILMIPDNGIHTTWYVVPQERGIRVGLEHPGGGGFHELI
jgi:hypothetical protein